MDVIRISDIRNELLESDTWIDQLTPAQLSKLRGASDKVAALVEELRAHPAAAAEASLKSRLEKIEKLNTELRKGFPAE